MQYAIFNRSVLLDYVRLAASSFIHSALLQLVSQLTHSSVLFPMLLSPVGLYLPRQNKPVCIILSAYSIVYGRNIDRRFS